MVAQKVSRYKLEAEAEVERTVVDGALEVQKQDMQAEEDMKVKKRKEQVQQQAQV